MYLGNRVEVTGDGAGAYVVPLAEAARGAGIYGIARYYIACPSRRGLAFGYSRIQEREIEEGIKKLRNVL